jgi:hypothetical protein
MPDGKYGAECKGFTTGEYKSGGTYLEFEWVILGPTHAGRRVWQKTTLNHENPDRRKYGEGDRRKIAKAIGQDKLTNANEAVGKAVSLVLKTKGDYQNVVNVSSYGEHSGPPPAAATVMPAPAPWAVTEDF